MPKDVAEAKLEADRSQASVEVSEELHLDAFVKHLLAMPDVGEDADFERDLSRSAAASRNDAAGSV